jgi:hypothetical protein
VGPDDARDDRQAEADPGVVDVEPSGAALERLGEGRDHVRVERLAGVLDGQQDVPGALDRADVRGAVLRQVVVDSVLQQVRDHLQQQGVRAAGRGDVAAVLDGDAVPLREGEECLDRLLGDERHVDGLRGEALIGAAEQQQRTR